MRRLISVNGGYLNLALRIKSGGSLDAEERVLCGILKRYEHLEEKIRKTLRSKQFIDLKYGDAAFPQCLVETADTPFGLILQGEMNSLTLPAVAIVGARRASPAGLETARYLAGELARCRIAIVSGLASGIDAAAHEGALAAGGTTVAVFGSGLESCYPQRNRKLAAEITESGGLLVSEYPPWERPAQRNFPERNRIISGLSMAVLVVEAASRSGSLITARMALEQGRDVMAVPGPRTSPLSKGCHRLIRQGAALVEEPEDVLEALNLPALVQTSAGKLRPGEEPQQLKPSEHQVLAAVGYQYTSLITIATNSRIDSQYLTSSLLSLELKGLISSYGDGYIRHRPT